MKVVKRLRTALHLPTQLKSFVNLFTELYQLRWIAYPVRDASEVETCSSSLLDREAANSRIGSCCHLLV